MCCVLALAPADLIDLLLDLERLEIVELWLVRLELGVELVLASLFLFCRSIRIERCGSNRRNREGKERKEATEVMIRS